ncbi:hypothetical protein CC80DRAFT_507400 [Byssothecium circinans]|uniref:Uncharacterized protein n=1 Tax=Byssothecium circinans TaxID=147558 RepID=A0A6A5TKG0_9PLEO|nr:hypothetical protein CC80DRAFT_507400 [Byssothecium circinans]
MAQPPPRKSVSTRISKGFAALAANKEKVEAIHTLDTYVYPSGGGLGWPRTCGKRREQMRTQFEEFMEAVYGVTEIEEVWNQGTFVTRSKEFLEGLLNISKGMFEEKIQTSTLWDGELAIIFRFIMEQKYGVSNLKQHWAAMLLAWITAARPGSFTVCQGYEKGASLGVLGRVRDTDESLRWSDVEFVHMKVGIAVRITFRYHKGYRDPNAENSVSDASRTFTFLPTRAYERGLFSQSLDEILDGKPNGIVLRTNPDIASQAVSWSTKLLLSWIDVFISANQAGSLVPDKPMTEKALNPKLAKLCASIGLLERNTYYSLRRTAIIETCRGAGTEVAKDLAFHKASANSIMFYDNVGFGDMDMTSFRLSGPAGMGREEVRKFFSQTNMTTWKPEEGEHLNLKQMLESQVKQRLVEQEDYIEVEMKLKSIYNEIGDGLQYLQSTGQIPEDELIPFGFSSRKGAKYATLAQKYGLSELSTKLHDHLANRKRMAKKIRHRLRKEIRKELKEKHEAVVKQNVHMASRRLTPSGFEPRDVRGVTVPKLGQSAMETALGHDDFDIGSDDEDDDGVDEEVIENQNVGNREEPECWVGLDKNVDIQLGGGNQNDDFEPSAEASDARREFLMLWIKKISQSIVSQSNLQCPRCQTDPTMDKKAKDRKFVRAALNKHMRGEVHTREAQLRRALKQDGKTKTTLIMCPGCKRSPKGTTAFMRHLRDVTSVQSRSLNALLTGLLQSSDTHPEQLWEEIDSASEEEIDSISEEESEFEGFSSARTDESEFQGFSSNNAKVAEGMETPFDRLSLEPTYEGKGKGRAD